jgi:arginyl-tRNA synthetase
MQVMVNTARSISEELGKLDDFDAKELSDLYETIGLGALKYFILKVDPKKRILFDPSESIDFNGNTGPFIQYTHARICSLSRKSDKLDPLPRPLSILHPKEKYLVKMLLRYPDVIQESARHFSPAMIANFTFDLVKEYNQFYQLVPIYGAENSQDQAFRLGLSAFVGRVISSSMNLLGISVPDRM